MEVTIVGSYESVMNRPENIQSDKYEMVFKRACKHIGHILAEDGHRLIVAHSENPKSAEAIALEGFREIYGSKYRYFQCIQHSGDAKLKAHLDAVEMSDVVILIGGGNGTYASGLSALRRKKVMIPIPVFGGSAKDMCEIPEINQLVLDEMRNLDFSSNEWVQILTDSIQNVLKAYPRVLIIHGRGDSGEKLREFINRESSNKDGELLGIAEPLIMNLTGAGAVSVPQVFEELASQVSAAIAIVTADDIGGFARIAGKETIPATALKLEVRARENVWVEVGWFWGRLGRERIFLWLQDEVEIPSDLQGVARKEANSIEEAESSICAFLKGLRSPRKYSENVC